MLHVTLLPASKWSHFESPKRHIVSVLLTASCWTPDMTAQCIPRNVWPFGIKLISASTKIKLAWEQFELSVFMLQMVLSPLPAGESLQMAAATLWAVTQVCHISLDVSLIMQLLQLPLCLESCALTTYAARMTMLTPASCVCIAFALYAQIVNEAMHATVTRCNTY